MTTSNVKKKERLNVLIKMFDILVFLGFLYSLQTLQ